MKMQMTAYFINQACKLQSQKQPSRASIGKCKCFQVMVPACKNGSMCILLCSLWSGDIFCLWILEEIQGKLKLLQSPW